MKIKLYGTAAAEGIPALFCNCLVCKNAKERKGKNLRTRTQALIDENLLIDFPGDTLMHKVMMDLPLEDIKHLLITHSHHDHFFAEDLMMRMSPYANDINHKLWVYGNKKVKEMYDRAENLEGLSELDRLEYKVLEPYKRIKIEDYDVTPYIATHGYQEDCYIYNITKENKSILYGNDSGYFSEEVWNKFKEHKFDLVILDCTHQNSKGADNHMGFNDNLKVKNRLVDYDLVHEKTKFVITHFSHNGGLSHEEIDVWADENGFITAYDGIEIEV